MGAISARFFGYVQDADFYRRLHREAVDLLPPGAGRTWFDMGCGPGLVARLAHDRGYNAVGFDVDADMVKRARGRTTPPAGPRFAECGLDEVLARHGRADVVSAASLLSVLPDRRAGLARLLDLVAPGGTLLLVETSEKMASAPGALHLLNTIEGCGRWVLPLWARARRGKRAVDVAELCPQPCSVQSHPLLGGLVNAWIVRRD